MLTRFKSGRSGMNHRARRNNYCGELFSLGSQALRLS
jgi:hypothetical protein